MGRRNTIQFTEHPVDPTKVRDSAARQLMGMLKRYDMASFHSQMHAADMVDLLAGFAMDPLQPVEFRRQCANDVLDRGYGKPATRATVEIIDPAAQVEPGVTVRDEINAVRASADVFQELNSLVARRVPPEQWPELVRQAAGDSLTYFAEAEAPEGG